MGESLILDGLSSWHADWPGRRVLVLGAGAIGFSVADTLRELGARVAVVADDVSEEHRELLGVIGADLVLPGRSAGPPAAVAAFDAELCVATAGHGFDWAPLLAAPVIGDVELAWRVRDKTLGRPPTEWICVTGDGAGETVDLTARMLAAAGIRAAPSGGAGVPAIDAVRDPAAFQALVVELTGTDLALRPRLGPLAGACLGAEPEPSERRLQGAVYADARVACVYSLADEGTRELVADAEVQEGCRAIGYGLGVPGPSELGVVEDLLVDRAFLDERRTSALELATLHDLRAAGLGSPPDVTRVLAAAALARSAGAPPAAVRDALRAIADTPPR